jgi:hypothetical protein
MDSYTSIFRTQLSHNMQHTFCLSVFRSLENSNGAWQRGGFGGNQKEKAWQEYFVWHGIAFGASEIFKLMEWLRARVEHSGMEFVKRLCVLCFFEGLLAMRPMLLFIISSFIPPASLYPDQILHPLLR